MEKGVGGETGSSKLVSPQNHLLQSDNGSLPPPPFLLWEIGVGAHKNYRRMACICYIAVHTRSNQGWL